jgi:hypothetical protein
VEATTAPRVPVEQVWHTYKRRGVYGKRKEMAQEKDGQAQAPQAAEKDAMAEAPKEYLDVTG